MYKNAINERNEFKLYFDKPEVTGNEAFIPIMEDYNSGDPDRMKSARDAACAQMERVIVQMINQKYKTYAPMHLGELKQSGFIGVLTGLAVVPGYDPYGKFTPSAFFYKYIKHELCDYINNLGPAKVSSHYSGSLKKVRKAIEVYIKNGEPYDETTIAQYENMSLDTVKVCFDIINAEEGTMSYNDLVDVDTDEDSIGSMGGVSMETPEKTYEEMERSNDVHEAIDTTLTENEKFIILNHFGFNGEIMTMNEIAKELNISENQVKKLQKKALEKLRVTKLRQWHAGSGAFDGGYSNGAFSFFPETTNDDVQFSSLLADFTFGQPNEKIG